MSAEREKKRQAMIRLLAQARGNTFTQEAEADYVLNHGGDVTLPPEPEWKPGQVASVYASNPEPYIGLRSTGGWRVVAGFIHDSEVTDVEPVAVLTAEDRDELLELRNRSGFVGVGAIRRFFAERGLSTDDH